MRLRWRLTLYAAGVIAIGMVIFAILLIQLARAGGPEDQARTLGAIADDIAPVADTLTTTDLQGTTPLFPADLTTSLDVFVTVYDDSGQPLYTTGTIDGAAPRLPDEIIQAVAADGAASGVVDAGGAEVSVQARAWNGADGTQGILVVGQPTAFVDEQLTGLRVFVWVAVFITLIAAVLAAWLAAGRALKPLRQLAATTDEIGRTGDLSRRLPDVTTDDELGALTRSFNDMLEQLERSRARIEQALDAQRRFVADASHELRTPLTTIRSNAGFLRDRPEADTADRNDAIADIAAEAERMTRLVNDLLHLAQADAGRPTAMQALDLADVLLEVEDRSSRLETSYEFDVDGSVHVVGDFDALQQLAWILLDNAGKYGGSKVMVRLRETQGRAELVVEDDGDGFPPGDVDRVFERFYRADPARSPAGSGLGLAIAREIAVAHGGSITAANAAGRGAVVTVTLPLATT